MKKLASLLMAVALLAPAFAQKSTPQVTSQKLQLHAVAPAAKPLLLHTGKPLTANDKRQFLAAVIKTHPAATRKTQAASAQPSTITLTPGQVSQGSAYLIMENPGYVDATHNEFQINVGDRSNISFVIAGQPNTAYLLAVKVTAVYANPQFTIYTGTLGTDVPITSENFTGSQGDNEFAYGVVSNSAGNILITIYSANSLWSFDNCEITSTAF
jgi:hypothetical protein